MRWFDTGVNLLDPRFDVPALLSDSLGHNVTDILVIASHIDESIEAVELLRNHPSDSVSLHVTAGVHPHHADHTDAHSWIKLRSLLADNTVCAVGECGLDFNRNFSTAENQIRAFDAQLQIAREYQKGVYLHEREAFEQQCKMLKSVHHDLPFMVAHCFTGSAEQMQTYLDLGCHIGITGWLCDDKRGQELQQAVKTLPLNKLLLETDAPYLFPKTIRPRAKENAPKYLIAIAEKIAEIKEVSVEEVAHAAYQNATALFTP